MNKSIISLTGKPFKAPKIKEDGVVELLFKVEMSSNLPSGLKSLGSTNYIVYISPKQYDKLGKVTTDTLLNIEGEIKATTTTKGLAVVLVNTLACKIIPNDNPLAEGLVQVLLTPTLNTDTKQHPSKKSYTEIESTLVSKRWFELPELQGHFVTVNSSKIDIINPEHTHPKALSAIKLNRNLKTNNLHVVIAPYENQRNEKRYKLLVGMNAIMNAQIFKKSVTAFIFDGTKKEFEEKYLHKHGLNFTEFK